MRRVLFSLLITGWFALPMSGSQSTYNGPTLRVAYDGPIVVANSQLRYLGEDMLTFDTAEYLAQQAPNLAPLRPAIDTWAAMHAIHPRALIHVLQAYWPLAVTSATAGEKETVHQIATALAMIYHEQRPDPLAASKALMAVADAYHLKVELPAELATSERFLPAKPLWSSVGSSRRGRSATPGPEVVLTATPAATTATRSTIGVSTGPGVRTSANGGWLPCRQERPGCGPRAAYRSSTREAGRRLTITWRMSSSRTFNRWSAIP